MVSISINLNGMWHDVYFNSHEEALDFLNDFDNCDVLEDITVSYDY